MWQLRENEVSSVTQIEAPHIQSQSSDELKKKNSLAIQTILKLVQNVACHSPRTLKSMQFTALGKFLDFLFLSSVILISHQHWGFLFSSLFTFLFFSPETVNPQPTRPWSLAPLLLPFCLFSLVSVYPLSRFWMTKPRNHPEKGRTLLRGEVSQRYHRQCSFPGGWQAERFVLQQRGYVLTCSC